MMATRDELTVADILICMEFDM